VHLALKLMLILQISTTITDQTDNIPLLFSVAVVPFPFLGR
jgi:hypothetical protein